MVKVEPLITLQRLKEVTSAYSDFVTITESDLPDYYKGVFPHHCKCGGEVIIKSSTAQGGGYTELQCCNPDCWVKMAHRLAYFCKTLGYKGFGVATAYTLFEGVYTQLTTASFLEVFSLPATEVGRYLTQSQLSLFQEIKEDILIKRCSFVDAVAALGIPCLGKRSKIFNIVKTPQALVNCVLGDKIGPLCDMAGVMSPMHRFQFEIYKLDIAILLCELMPLAVATPDKEVNIAITGSVVVEGKKISRAEFIALCESIGDVDKGTAYKLVETKARNKLEYVIADGPSSSSKYSLGKELGILITAQDFYQMLVEKAQTEEILEAGEAGSESTEVEENLARVVLTDG